jgi:hypothetical protein
VVEDLLELSSRFFPLLLDIWHQDLVCNSQAKIAEEVSNVFIADLVAAPSDNAFLLFIIKIFQLARFFPGPFIPTNDLRAQTTVEIEFFI